MTKDEIIDKDEVLNMAIQAGAIPVHKDPKNKALVGNENIEAFAKLVADVATAKEREEIAQFIDSTELASLPDALKQHYARMLSFYSSQIRARGQ